MAHFYRLALQILQQGLVTFFSLTVGHKKILVVLVSVLYYGEFQLACRETWWMKITVLSTSYLLYDPNLFTTKGWFSGASKKCLYSMC